MTPARKKKGANNLLEVEILSPEEDLLLEFAARARKQHIIEEHVAEILLVGLRADRLTLGLEYPELERVLVTPILQKVGLNNATQTLYPLFFLLVRATHEIERKMERRRRVILEQLLPCTIRVWIMVQIFVVLVIGMKIFFVFVILAAEYVTSRVDHCDRVEMTFELVAVLLVEETVVNSVNSYFASACEAQFYDRVHDLIVIETLDNLEVVRATVVSFSFKSGRGRVA